MRVLSCGSDRTLRMWNVGERRCELCARPQRASLYALAPDAGWRRVFVGGRSGAVTETSLARDPAPAVGGEGAEPPARVVCDAREIVLRLHVEPSAPSRLWIASPASEVTCWEAPAEERDGPVRSATPLPAAPMRTISGAPGVRRHAALPSKLGVLTEDTSGAAAEWDLLRGRCVRRYPRAGPGEEATFDRLVRERASALVAVPSWFSLSSRSGLLEVTLGPGSAFNAEAYPSDLGVGGADEVRAEPVAAPRVRASRLRAPPPTPPAAAIQPGRTAASRPLRHVARGARACRR